MGGVVRGGAHVRTVVGTSTLGKVPKHLHRPHRQPLFVEADGAVVLSHRFGDVAREGHKAVSTEDIVYGPEGLKVEGSSALTADYALHNADSWAYFVMDLLGYLVSPDADNGIKPCTAILRTPTRQLNLS